MNFFKIVRFDFMNILRNPTLVVANIALPPILMGIMGFVTKGSYGAAGISSYDYYGVTMMIFTALMVCMTASNTFMEEKVKSGNTRIIYAPVSKTQIFLSKLTATFFLGSISFSLTMLAGQSLFHIDFGGKNLLYVMLLINALTLFGCCFGTLFCCIFKSEEGANGIMQIFVMLFAFFGGAFFPPASLGKTIELLSNLSPLKWVTECAFQVIYEDNFGIYLPTIAIVLLFSLACIAACQIIFKPEEYV